MQRILVVEDEPDILAIIKETLHLAGYWVDAAESARAVSMDRLGSYDLILLDILMPEVTGIAFCQQIRPLVDCPILFLTALTQEEDLVTGLAAGADDYICKPFGIQELLARVRAHLRRESRERHHVLLAGVFKFDLSAKQLQLGQEVLSLTKSEYEICEYLAKHKGQVFTKEQLYQHLYGWEERGTPQVVVEHIKNIRAKCGRYDQNPIQTIWRLGYKWQ